MVINGNMFSYISSENFSLKRITSKTHFSNNNTHEYVTHKILETNIITILTLTITQLTLTITQNEKD